MNLIPPGFNIEVSLPSKDNIPYVAVACYANGLEMQLKHLLPVNGHHWTLKGTMEVIWATGNCTLNDNVSPFGDDTFLEAIDAELHRQFTHIPKTMRLVKWPDARNEKPHVVSLELTCLACKCFIK